MANITKSIHYNLMVIAATKWVDQEQAADFLIQYN